MQIPQLYRRGVVRSLDDRAARQLKTFFIQESIRAELLAIPTESEFEIIWESGVFQRINEVCQTEISDYEEVELQPVQVDLALEVVLHAMQEKRVQIPFLHSLEQLLEAAKVDERSVYFDF